MRTQLQKIEGERKPFIGTFIRYGKKSRYKPKKVITNKGKIMWIDYDITVLMNNIHDTSGKLVADHLWFNLTKGFEQLGDLKEGTQIKFEARVKPYVKGYVNYRQDIDDREIDYRLSNPTKFILLNGVS
jgi:hypothetical protein